MIISLVAFTSSGKATMHQIANFLYRQGNPILDACFLPHSDFSLHEWTAKAFQSDAIVFVGACGIAVRAIAPFVKDKYSDPAVVSIDDLGKFAVPLLSGHVGGANELAVMIANATDGIPVISTATDLHDKFAVDVWAKTHGIRLCERQYAKEVSAALLDNKPVEIISDYMIDDDLPNGLVFADSGELGICISCDTQIRPFKHTLHAVPQIVTIGVGCRKNVTFETFERVVLDTLKRNNLSIESVACLATIDRKAEEPCIHAFCNTYQLPFVTASAEVLASVQGDFTASEFVGRVTGVDNVCERAAVLAGGGTLLLCKQCQEGVTVAASAPDWRVCFKRSSNKHGRTSI